MFPDIEELVRTREGEAWRRVGQPWSLAPWCRACAVVGDDRGALLLELEDDWADTFAADREASGENVLASFSRGRLALAAGPTSPYRSANVEHEGARFALLPWTLGDTLRGALGRARRGAQHDPRAVATIALDALRGLTRTESLSGLTPASVIIASDGTASVRGPLLDAIVRRTSEPSASALPYLAPEALRGEAESKARLFSLGVMLHELLAGRSLFPDGPDGPRRIARWQPNVRHLPAAPGPLRQALWLMLQTDPTRRSTPRTLIALLAPLYAPSPAIAEALLGEKHLPVPYFVP